MDQRFNGGMSEQSCMLMNKLLVTYQGFKEVQELVDVGGGVGLTLNLIISMYPHISRINFNMSHVLADAPHYLAMTHVAVDMFDSVPTGQAIFMKWILHNWSDVHCVMPLKNQHKALTEKGKVTVVNTMLSVIVGTSPFSRRGFHIGFLMLASNPEGKERIEQEFEYLAKSTGFLGGFKPLCCVNAMGHGIPQVTLR